MRVVLLLVTLVASCAKTEVSDSEKYQIAYDYIVANNESIELEVMDSLQFLELTTFMKDVGEDFKINNESELFMHLSEIDERNYFEPVFSVELNGKFDKIMRPTHVVFFSRSYKNYLLVELFDLSNYQEDYNKSYSDLTTLGESEQYLFVFGEASNEIKRVHKTTVSYN